MKLEETPAIHGLSKPRRVFTRNVLLAAVSVLIAVTVLLSVLWLGGNEDELLSLSQVKGGVKCAILRDTSYHWKYTTVHIEQQGIDSVWWNFYYTNLSTGSWIAEAGDIRLLGDTALRLYVVEAEGDGTVGREDIVVITTLDSTEFSPDTVYSFALTHGSLAVSGTEYRMDFWFEEGVLETGPMKITNIPF